MKTAMNKTNRWIAPRAVGGPIHIKKVRRQAGLSVFPFGVEDGFSRSWHATAWNEFVRFGSVKPADADNDIREGRVKTFDNVDDMLASLGGK